MKCFTCDKLLTADWLCNLQVKNNYGKNKTARINVCTAPQSNYNIQLNWWLAVHYLLPVRHSCSEPDWTANACHCVSKSSWQSAVRHNQQLGRTTLQTVNLRHPCVQCRWSSLLECLKVIRSCVQIV